MRTRPLLVLAVLGLLLGACTGSGGGGGGGTAGVITLRFQSLAWQQESVTATKELVKEWNATHPQVKVAYVQGSWDSVHDQLLTSFEGGAAPDIIHDASDDLADFAYGGGSPICARCCPPGSSPTSRAAAGRRRPSGTGSSECRSSRSRAF